VGHLLQRSLQLSLSVNSCISSTLLPSHRLLSTYFFCPSYVWSALGSSSTHLYFQ
jgi:hypothetical protein